MNSLFLLCAFTLFMVGCTQDDKLGDQVVVKVNDKALIAKNFAENLAHNLRSLDALTVKDQDLIDKHKEDIIREFVIQSITSDWARERNIIVKKEALEAEISSIRANYPDDLAFRRALAEQGMVFTEWKEKVRMSLLQRLVMQEIVSHREEPSSKEIENYYNANMSKFTREEEVRIRQVLVNSKNNAERIRTELRNGKKLAEMAKLYSIGPEASQEGDIGWIQKGTLDIFDKAFNMRVGQISPILKSNYGYHIFEVTGKRPKRTLKLNVVKDQIKRNLMARREQGMYSSWLEEQIRKARVFKNEKLISAIVVETKGEK